jgi:Anti-sigma-K factor rskA/Putative zinc-finger
MTQPTEPLMTHEEAIDLAPAYVLQALEPSEEAAVRAHLSSCQLPHPEFDELGGVVPALLELDESELVEPPAALGDRIVAAAAADLEERTLAEQARTERTRAVAATPIPFPSAEERTIRAERTQARTSPLDWVFRIAAVIAIVALGAWGLNLQSQLNEARTFDAAVATVLQAANQPGAKVAVLAPAQNQQGSGLAAVQADGSVVLAMHDLPASSGSEVYTTWVILPDQAPTSVGDFAVGSSGVQQFTSRPAQTPAGATIAITREPNAGNTAPKGPVVSAGVATTPGATS